MSRDEIQTQRRINANILKRMLRPALDMNQELRNDFERVIDSLTNKQASFLWKLVFRREKQAIEQGESMGYMKYHIAEMMQS